MSAPTDTEARLAELVEREFPCVMECAQFSDWPIEAHAVQCAAFYRLLAHRVARETWNAAIEAAARAVAPCWHGCVSEVRTLAIGAAGGGERK